MAQGIVLGHQNPLIRRCRLQCPIADWNLQGRIESRDVFEKVLVDVLELELSFHLSSSIYHLDPVPCLDHMNYCPYSLLDRLVSVHPDVGRRFEYRPDWTRFLSPPLTCLLTKCISVGDGWSFSLRAARNRRLTASQLIVLGMGILAIVFGIYTTVDRLL